MPAWACGSSHSHAIRNTRGGHSGNNRPINQEKNNEECTTGNFVLAPRPWRGRGIHTGHQAGNLVVVWTSDETIAGTDLDVAVASSNDGGATWSDPGPLNSDAGTDTRDDTELALATDGAGTWIAAWTKVDSGTGNNTDIRVARSTDDGASWSEPVALTFGPDDVNAGSSDGQPHLATDGAVSL